MYTSKILQQIEVNYDNLSENGKTSMYLAERTLMAASYSTCKFQLRNKHK